MRKIFTIWSSLFLLCFFSEKAVAQDPQFSQFYAAPLFVNPAFTGTSLQHRFVVNYRNQWPELKNQFLTYNASYDVYLSEIKSGLGFQVTHDMAGIAALQYTSASGFFSYQFNLSKTWVFKPGLSFSGYRRSVDPTKFRFADQIARGQGRSTIEFVNVDPKTYFDFSSGGLLYNKNFWFGFAAHHLNKPNQSLLGETAELPVKYSLHGGFRYVIRTGPLDRVERAIWGAINYKTQNISSQIDIGAYCEFFPVIFGVWYRGLPVGKGEDEYMNRDAVVVMVGTEMEFFRFGYSYDITVSNLIANVGGAHEISIIFEFKDNRTKKRRVRAVPCPSF